MLAADGQRTVLLGVSVGNLHTFTYAPYGHRAVGSDRFGLLGFNGERPDSVTGHYLLGNGYRAFNPVLMRFNGPDSLSPFGSGGFNTYAYCAGDPINRIDPDGHVFIFRKIPRWLSQSAPDLFKRSPSTVNSISTRTLSEVIPGRRPASLNSVARRSTGSEGRGSFSGGSVWREDLRHGAGRSVSSGRSSSEGSGSFSGGSQWGEYIESRAPTSIDSNRASSLYPESSISSGSTRSSVSFESPRMRVDLDFLGSAESPLSKVQIWLDTQQVPTSARPIDKTPQSIQRVRRQR
ncbi:RHS repeat-associated core domain-containing protein [Pseudomonas sp. GM55]|uniref:RHS repeat-associated core domain-containing protein n=1 Tax=Pseudomonas sp. GM55 TaxID=1144333 RepID=UPI001EE64315|nr:RHS repeat-associated core domain-containing protein [Pseudomonas sp. GM55]